MRSCYLDSVRPFFDNNLIEFIASIPNEYLEEHKLYKHLVLKYYPEYFKKIPRNSDKPTFIKKDIEYRIQKLEYSIKKKLRKWHVLPKIATSYANYCKWIQEPVLNCELKNLIFNKDAFVQNYINKDEIDCCFNDLDSFANIRKILNIASMEIYFSMLKQKKKNDCIIKFAM